MLIDICLISRDPLVAFLVLGDVFPSPEIHVLSFMVFLYIVLRNALFRMKSMARYSFFLTCQNLASSKQLMGTENSMQLKCRAHNVIELTSHVIPESIGTHEDRSNAGT